MPTAKQARQVSQLDTAMHQDYPMAVNRGQVSSFEKKVNYALKSEALKADYLAATCEFGPSYQKRDKMEHHIAMAMTNIKTASKLMGTMPISSFQGGSQMPSSISQQPAKPSKNNHHIKAHSQTFESGHPM